METPKAPGLDGVMAVGSPITAESAMGWYAAARWWGILADHEGGPAHQYAADDLAMACSDLVWTMQHRARFLSLFDSTL